MSFVVRNMTSQLNTLSVSNLTVANSLESVSSPLDSAVAQVDLKGLEVSKTSQLIVPLLDQEGKQVTFSRGSLIQEAALGVLEPVVLSDGNLLTLAIVVGPDSDPTLSTLLGGSSSSVNDAFVLNAYLITRSNTFNPLGGSGTVGSPLPVIPPTVGLSLSLLVDASSADPTAEITDGILRARIIYRKPVS